MGYPFDNSRQIGSTSQFENGMVLILNEPSRLTLPANFDGQFEDGLSVSDSPGTVIPSATIK